MSGALTAVVSVVRGRLTATGHQWLDAALAPDRLRDIDQLLANYTAASRRAGMEPLAVDAPTRTLLASLAPGLSCDHWTVADGARATLLLALSEVQPLGDEWTDAATACFENGDASEQQSWLRVLGLMPQGPRLVSLAIDACRSHIQPLFESIACENPYPSEYFSAGQFNQLVLKAMFTGVRLDRIAGLARRLNPDLSRMARDYAAERRAAGRSVPADLALALHDARERELEEHLS
jgi:hypothetical protein